MSTSDTHPILQRIKSKETKGLQGINIKKNKLMDYQINFDQ